MNARGGCCLTRHTTTAQTAVSAYNSSKIDRIMLKYRPIAPKPTADGAVLTSSDSASDNYSKATASAVGRRGRKKRCTIRRNRKSPSPESAPKIITLQLLPEVPDLTPTTTPVVGSYVIIEAVTDTCFPTSVDMGSLDKDTCPVIVSDSLNRVYWVNEAYRRMIVGDTWRDQGVAVGLVMREKVPDGGEGFTCRVRVQGGNREEGNRGLSLTLPCDVGKIDGGGFAWRLDVDAALSLGR